MIKAYSLIGRVNPFDREKEKDEKASVVQQTDVTREIYNFFRNLNTTAVKLNTQATTNPTAGPSVTGPTQPTPARGTGTVMELPPQQPNPHVQCHNCLEWGHISPNCPHPQVPWKQKALNRAKVEAAQTKEVMPHQATAAAVQMM